MSGPVPRSRWPARERGQVVIVFALTLVVLIGFVGLVLDLGNLYGRKTELQNAADAAALAGAVELVGTPAGITAARDQAIAVAALNSSDFGQTPVAITEANIRFGPTPDGPWSDTAAATASPGNKRFIKVDTSGIAQGTRPTWFMHVLNSALADTTTNGMAVAGTLLCDGLPMFVCARGANPPNFGFEPGREYQFAASPGYPIGPGNVGYMDPVPPGAPALITGVGASQQDKMRQVMCVGKMYCLSAPITLTSLTQAAFGPMADALNTRFNVYQGPLNDLEHKQTCPADTNIKEYLYDAAPGSGGPRDWMEPDPTRQTEDQGGAPGAHWAGVEPAPGTPGVSGYPAGSPYGQTSGVYFQNPAGAIAKQPGRRILTLAIADASNCAGGANEVNGANKPVTIVGFARFLMPVQAVDSGPPTDRGVYAEFIEGVSALATNRSDIKLFR